MCAELRELHSKYPNYMDCGVYDKEFKKWGGYSGFDLPTLDGWVVSKANQLIRIDQEMKRLDNEYAEICKTARGNLG